MAHRLGVVAFAYGTPSTIQSNRLIAKMALRTARNSAGIYTQQDIQIPQEPEGPKVTYYRDELPGEPPPTLRIARGAVQWMINSKITDVIVVCAKPHAWRCIRDIKYAIKEAGVIINVILLPEVQNSPEEIWFCPDSTQPHTTSRKAWRRSERKLEYTPMFLYKLVAS